MIKNLSEVSINKTARVVEIVGDVYIKRRLLELGFVSDVKVKILSISPLKNSYLVALRGYVLALRKNSLELVRVEINDWKNNFSWQSKHRQNNFI